MGSAKLRYAVVMPTAKISSREKELDMILLASSRSPRPMAMAARGAPPEPASMAKAFMNIIRGMHRPTPVRAMAPTPWPM